MPFDAAGLDAERRRRGQERIGRRPVAERVLQHRDLALEQRAGRVKVIGPVHTQSSTKAMLSSAPSGTCGGRPRLLEQRAVLEDREVELVELDPVGARHQQLAEAAALRRRLVPAEAGGRYCVQWPPLVSSPSLMKSTPALVCMAHTSVTASPRRSSLTSSCAHTSIGRGQRADVGGENPVRTTSHGRDLRSVCCPARPRAPAGVTRDVRAYVCLGAGVDERSVRRLTARRPSVGLGTVAMLHQRKERHSMPAPSVPSTHTDLLDASVATLATIGPDGRPQVSAVWFLAEDGVVKVSLNVARQKTKNLAANPAVTVFILDPANPARYLEIRGDATLEPDDDYAFADRSAPSTAAPTCAPWTAPTDVVSWSPSTPCASTPSTSAPADRGVRSPVDAQCTRVPTTPSSPARRGSPTGSAGGRRAASRPPRGRPARRATARSRDRRRRARCGCAARPAAPRSRSPWRTSMTTGSRRSTMTGASPSESSSSSSSRGRRASARPSASICCSPPDSSPARRSASSASAGKYS